MKTFEKPFSEEEEKYYLACWKKGDLEARNKLIDHNLRLVAHIAKKYQSPEYDPDDLISTGIIGLIKGVMTFDCTKNNRLATYAARCIENELLMYKKETEPGDFDAGKDRNRSGWTGTAADGYS